VQEIYESIRIEALQNEQPASFLLERVRQYGVAGLFPGAEDDFPFLLYVQSVPRPAWSGQRDLHRETLRQVYEFLTQELRDPASCHLCQSVERETGEGAHDWITVGSIAGLCGPEPNAAGRGVHR
jgi:hypothetical protein